MIENILLAFTVTTLLAGSPSPMASQEPVETPVEPLSGAALEELQIMIGDRVHVTDAYHPEGLSTEAVVAIDGTLLLPELGAVQVAGLVPMELQMLLMERYSVYYDLLDIRVRVVEAPKHYTLLGELPDPGRRQFEGDLSIWEAVMLNDPDLRSANLGRVRLIRPDPVDPLLITVDIAQMLETGDLTHNVSVEDLDVIFVPPAPLVKPSVPELLADAAAGMEQFAGSASPSDAKEVRELITKLRGLTEEYEQLTR